MSWLSDATGINWDIGKGIEESIRAPADFIKGIFEGKKFDDNFKETFNRISGAGHEIALGWDSDIQKNVLGRFARDNPSLNHFLLDIPAELAAHGQWTKDRLNNIASDQGTLNQVQQLGAKVAAVLGAAYGIGYLPTATQNSIYSHLNVSSWSLKDAGIYAGLYSKAAQGDYVGALTSAPGVDFLPNLPSLPPGVPNPIDFIKNPAPSAGTPAPAAPGPAFGDTLPGYPPIAQYTQATMSPYFAIAAVVLVAYLISRRGRL